MDDYHIYTNIINMLDDRKYKYNAISADQFSKLRSGDHVIINDDQYSIAIIKKKSFVKKDFNEIIKNVKTKHVIIVSKCNIEKRHKKIANTLKEKGFIIELIPRSVFNFHLTKHEYVPRHIIHRGGLDPDTVSFDCDKLPKILVTDPISVWFRAEPGDIFEIHRLGYENPIVISYRIVVKNYL